MFKTHMASNAFERIYEILVVDKLLLSTGMHPYDESNKQSYEELLENLSTYGLYKNAKDDPSAVREITEERLKIVNDIIVYLQQEMFFTEDGIEEKRIKQCMQLREILDEELSLWLVAVIGQERGETDIWKLNDFYHDILEDRKIIDKAIEIARDRYSYMKNASAA